MRHPRFSSFLLAALLAVLAQASPAQPSSFTATATPTRVPHLGYVRVTYQLDGAEASGFEAPDFSPFRQIGGASEQTSTTIVNGRVSRSMRVSFDLLAQEVGMHTIPPANVHVNGARVPSPPVTIEVLPAASPPTAAALADAEVFAQTVLGKDTVYVGERVLIESELLNRVDIRTYSMLAPLDLTGLQADQLRRFGSYPRRRRVGGEEFQVTRLQVLDAYATRPGRFDLGAQALDVGVVQPGRRRSFFFGPATESRRVMTAPVTLTVLPLPLGAPDDFAGAVGAWAFEGDFVGGAEITTADAVEFELTARGRGDVSRLTAPELSWPAGWRALPPETTRDESFETDSGMVFVRSFRYALVPEAPGRFSLGASLSYFDAEAAAYRRWSAAPVTVEVRAASGDTPAKRRDAPPAGAGSDLPLAPEASRVIGAFWVRQTWYWLLLAAVPLVLAGVGAWRVLRKRTRDQPHAPTDPLAEGRARLAEARARLDDPTGFYAAVLEALDRYAEDRLGLPRSAQSPEALRAAFARTGHDAHAEGFLRARALSDRGRYGGGTDRAGREEALRELERTLSA